MNTRRRPLEVLENVTNRTNLQSSGEKTLPNSKSQTKWNAQRLSPPSVTSKKGESHC